MVRKGIVAGASAVVGFSMIWAGSAKAETINGTGGTFPAPIYQKWFQQYGQESGVQFNYQALGSGAGIKAITNHTVDFGASDAPLTDPQMHAAPGIMHIPTVAGAVVISYRIPGINAGIHLTGDVIADIYLGKITKWNDPRITSLSPGTHFPALAITPFHRADGSGTTNIFTTYLSQLSGDWKNQVGHGTAVRWLRGLGGKGNAGVAELLKQSDGGIGYIELAYAVQNAIPYAAIRNSHGKYIFPSVESTVIAAEGSTMPPDFRKVITNTASPAGYPITGFTFILVYKNAKPEVKKFLDWALTKGQSEVSTLYYAPLPPNIKKRALAAVSEIR